MRELRIPLLLTLLLLSACVSAPPPAPPPEVDSATVDALAAANARVAELERALARCRSELDALRDELKAARLRIAKLEERLAAAEQAAAGDEVRRLERELATERQAGREAAAEIQAYEMQSQAMARDMQAMREQLDARDATLADPGPSSAEDFRVIETDAERPLVKTVFYATNRVRLARDEVDYLRAFYLPLGLLLATVVALLLIRRYIKERFQRRARLLAIVAGGAAFIVTAGLATQKTLQMGQRDNMLAVQYGNELRKPVTGEAAYERGLVEVSLPPQRDIGEVPRPSLVRFEFVVDPLKHFQLKAIRPSSHEAFYTDLQAALASDPADSAFVFVHGFHNTFEDAAFRTAQIAHDMRFPGAPIFFSWPSQGAVLDYLTDAKNVETTVLHLRQFLEELHAESGATRIHLIAHSMGSRALAAAVEDLGAAGASTDRFGELVFAAPDIARDLLQQKIGALDRVATGVTLYASAHDAALKLSRTLQGGAAADYQRAGETSPAPMVAPPMQTIDVSRATRGHSYISDSPRMMRDLAGLLDGSRRLDEASSNYVPIPQGSGYWVLPPE